MTADQARALGDWVAGKGRTLTDIFITHGHGDHWFAAGLLAERFGGRVVASADTIAQLRANCATCPLLWDKVYAGMIPPSPVTAEPDDPATRLLWPEPALTRTPINHASIGDDAEALVWKALFNLSENASAAVTAQAARAGTGEIGFEARHLKGHLSRQTTFLGQRDNPLAILTLDSLAHPAREVMCFCNVAKKSVTSGLEFAPSVGRHLVRLDTGPIFASKSSRLLQVLSSGLHDGFGSRFAWHQIPSYVSSMDGHARA